GENLWGRPCDRKAPNRIHRTGSIRYGQPCWLLLLFSRNRGSRAAKEREPAGDALAREGREDGGEDDEGSGGVHPGAMKIVTYNVNGLRQRVAQHGSLLRLLDSLDADIVCFQETKLSRQDLSADVTMPQGYEAFVSCTRTTEKGKIYYSGTLLNKTQQAMKPRFYVCMNMGEISRNNYNFFSGTLNVFHYVVLSFYSIGVATFCRVASAFSSKEVALPLAAEEGFTGLLEQSGKRDATKTDFLLEGLEDVTVEDVLKVDSEGRCIITDHGHFELITGFCVVLINIYGPRAEDDNKERVYFKHLFFKILQRRWESLLHQGRNICVVGDFNIAPTSIDCCDAGPGFEDNPFRKWLRSLLRKSGGSFFDVFRSKHPERKEAYTCWPQRVGGEEFNYGTRIDHILIAGQCLHQNSDGEGHNFFNCHVKDCDIMTQFKRGKDTVSRWNGGRSIKLEGSDHVPVYVSLLDLPQLPIHSTPSLAVRYIPEVRGWQQTIVSLLRKRQVPIGVNQDGLTSSSLDTDRANCSESLELSQELIMSNHEGELHVSEHPSGENFPSVDEDCDPSKKQQFGSSVGETGNSLMIMKAGKAKLGTRSSMIKNKKRSDTKCFQQTIRSFFQQYKSISSVNAVDSNMDSHTQVHILRQESGSCDVTEAADSSHITCQEANKDKCGSKESVHPCNQDETSIDVPNSFDFEKNNYALLEWQRIQQRMQTSLPLCKGHGEPCVARLVKKPGPNVGRGFYVCPRAKGPASNPEANCGYFKWASVKSRQKKT
ncbi:hypothetical protein Taro_029617, partial [Colocasia esculenta]|nr:hypothetical protein [Colocasia esculenta]